MTKDQLTRDLHTLMLVANTIVETVAECGDNGAPGGVLYAALMSKMSLETFLKIMNLLVQAGRLTTKGDLYFAVK